MFVGRDVCLKHARPLVSARQLVIHALSASALHHVFSVALSGCNSSGVYALCLSDPSSLHPAAS